MMGKKDNAVRTQMEIASLEELVPGYHLVRKLDEAINMSFIYEEVKDLLPLSSAHWAADNHSPTT